MANTQRIHKLIRYIIYINIIFPHCVITRKRIDYTWEQFSVKFVKKKKWQLFSYNMLNIFFLEADLCRELVVPIILPKQRFFNIILSIKWSYGCSSIILL